MVGVDADLELDGALDGPGGLLDEAGDGDASSGLDCCCCCQFESPPGGGGGADGGLVAGGHADLDLGGALDGPDDLLDEAEGGENCGELRCRSCFRIFPNLTGDGDGGPDAAAAVVGLGLGRG